MNNFFLNNSQYVLRVTHCQYEPGNFEQNNQQRSKSN